MSHKHAEGMVRFLHPQPFVIKVQIKKILIVDDDQFNIDILLDSFEDLQTVYTIETAQSGKEAVKKYKRFLPDILLLDVMLGDCTGYELCERVKKRKTPKMPVVILISGRATSDDIEKGKLAGADHYITKPFDVDDLIKLIDSIKCGDLAEMD